MVLRRILFVALIVCMATPAIAQQQMSRRGGLWQASLQTRYVPSKDIDLDNDSSVEIEDDLGWGFGFSYNINRRFNLGMGFTWRAVPYKATVVDVDDPSVTEDIYATLDMSTFALTGTWHVLESTLTPYVDGSWGWLMLDSNISAGDFVGCWWTPWGYYCGLFPATYGVTTWSASLGVGARWEPARDGNMFLKGGYEYGWTGEEVVENAHIFKLAIGVSM